MNILLVSTLKRRIAPEIFASRSRVISQLGEGLVKKGHNVSLLGTGDSRMPGVSIIPVIEKGWVDLPVPENVFHRDTATLMKQAGMILDLQDSFDVIHSHTYPDFFPAVIGAELKKPLLFTLHALYTDYIDELLAKFNKTYPIALSQANKSLYKNASIYDVVYNGVDTNLYSFKEEKEDYLFWIGRLARGKKDNGEYIDHKGVAWAIKLAEESGSKLKMLGPCEDIEFFNTAVKPHLSENIEWVGEVSAEQSVPVEDVVELMQNAKAFLMTINQEEPFGLVMTEAGSCGTPVIGFDRGAVREVISEGVTGFVVDPASGVDGLKEALSKIDTIEPEDCKQHVLENFSIDRMVENYEKVYSRLISKNA
jgi:glycosyltransferase involved in cell wall biosynthesis